MADHSFSHLLFYDNPIRSLCFLSLGMSFATLWIKKTPWLWGSFLLIATLLAFENHIVSSIALLPIFLLFFCHWLLKKKIAPISQLFLFVLATFISLALAFHLFPGFFNWRLLPSFRLSPDSYPFQLWLNFDKPFIGLFPLALSIPLLQSRAQLKKIAAPTLVCTLAAALIMTAISLQAGVVRWDPKLPTFFAVWCIDNLIFISIPEEAFFRGFFQRQIRTWFGESVWASVIAVLTTSLVFTLLHLNWVPTLPYLSVVFVAGLIFGGIYEFTRSIESSIFCHFTINFLQFCFFSYPALG